MTCLDTVRARSTLSISNFKILWKYLKPLRTTFPKTTIPVSIPSCRRAWWSRISPNKGRAACPFLIHYGIQYPPSQPYLLDQWKSEFHGDNVKITWWFWGYGKISTLERLLLPSGCHKHSRAAGGALGAGIFPIIPQPAMWFCPIVKLSHLLYLLFPFLLLCDHNSDV